ncbi:14539_t:CDS:2, partial [Acaulospora colombiana]
GKPPFNDKPLLETIRIIAGGLREEHVGGTPLDYIEIYKNAWQDDPTRRVTIGEIQSNLKNVRLKPVYEYTSNVNNAKMVDSSTSDMMSLYGYSENTNSVGVLSRGMSTLLININPSTHERSVPGDTSKSGNTNPGYGPNVNNTNIGFNDRNINNRYTENAGNHSRDIGPTATSPTPKNFAAGAPSNSAKENGKTLRVDLVGGGNRNGGSRVNGVQVFQQLSIESSSKELNNTKMCINLPTKLN